MKSRIKFLTLLVFLLCSTAITRAQEMDLPRSWITGGSINFSTQLNDGPLTFFNATGGGLFNSSSISRDSRYTYFNFTPYVGKEISRHWTIGLQMQYGFNNYKANDVPTIPVFGQVLDTVNLKRNENQYAFGLFGRYVFNPDHKFKVFLQPYANVSIASG